MKIMQVIPYFVPAWSYGGPVSVAYNVSKELVKRGHRVTVCTTDVLNVNSRAEEKEEVIDGIKLRRFRNVSGSLIHHHNIFFSPGMFSGIKKELSDFDIIHMHEYRTIQNVIVHHYAMRYSIPYVVQAHGSLPTTTTKQRLKKLYDNIWGYKLLRDASRVIALQETEVGQYKSMGVIEDKIRIVPNGIDLSEFDNLPQRGEFRKKYGLNDHEKIILYLGRIHETKGIDLLVRAFAGLTKVMDGVRLVIVGPNGGQLSNLTKLTRDLGVSDKVLFTGPIYERNKLEAYVDADIFVTPSFLGFPVTFLEACACGTPIITTENSDKLDWIHNQTGLVTAYDENQLKDAIARVLSSRVLTEQFRKNGQKLVRQRFTWSRIAEELEQIYLEARAIRQ